MINRLPTKAIFAACAAFMVFNQASYAFEGTVDQTFGAENNLAGVGRFLEVPGGPAVATWDLRTTVANTDFEHNALQGGSDGIQYVMRNPVNNSVDTNIVTFNVSPIDNVIPTISIAQSPYNNTSTWNGGNIPGDISQFRMTWDGGGSATIRDPSNQLSGLEDFAAVGSGTWVTFNDYQLRNEADNWGITLPQGVESVQLNWNSSNPTEGSDLTNEWVTFDANFSPNPNALPEPGSATLLGFCVIMAATAFRRRRS